MSQILLAPWRGQSDLPESDALLIHAYSLHQSSLCPCGCGNPADVSLDPAAQGSVDVDDSTVCAYRAALDEWRAQQKEPSPGALAVPVLDEKSYRIARARLAAVSGPHAVGADQSEE